MTSATSISALTPRSPSPVCSWCASGAATIASTSAPSPLPACCGKRRTSWPSASVCAPATSANPTLSNTSTAWNTRYATAAAPARGRPPRSSIRNASIKSSPCSKGTSSRWSKTWRSACAPTPRTCGLRMRLACGTWWRICARSASPGNAPSGTPLSSGAGARLGKKVCTNFGRPWASGLSRAASSVLTCPTSGAGLPSAAWSASVTGSPPAATTVASAFATNRRPTTPP